MHADRKIFDKMAVDYKAAVGRSDIGQKDNWIKWLLNEMVIGRNVDKRDDDRSKRCWTIWQVDQMALEQRKMYPPIPRSLSTVIIQRVTVCILGEGVEGMGVSLTNLLIAGSWW